jgi:hypothetical protein
VSLVNEASNLQLTGAYFVLKETRKQDTKKDLTQIMVKSNSMFWACSLHFLVSGFVNGHKTKAALERFARENLTKYIFF